MVFCMQSKLENRHFEAFLQNKLAEDKRSLFESFCKARLITGNETKKRFLKPLSIIKSLCQAFGLLVNKAVKFTKAFKYGIMSIPSAVATPTFTLFQSDKAGLRN